MTNQNQTLSSDASRAVEVASAIFESLSCGIEPPYTLLSDAEELGLSVEAIREKVEELYDSEDESDSCY